MKKKLAAALLLSCAAVCTAIGAPSATIGPSGGTKGAVVEKDTIVLVKVLDRLTPKTVKSGDIVLFSVAYPVKNKARQVVIEQSADAWGTIVRVPEFKALSTDEPSWDQKPQWTRPDRAGQLERERKIREKERRKAERRIKRLTDNGKKVTSEDEYPRYVDKNWGTLGITIDRAVTVNSKDIKLIAMVADEKSHTMITLDRDPSFDIRQMYCEQAKQAARNAQGVPTSPDQHVSRDITLAIPWNVFTTGTLSVVEPGTVLRAKVLETTVLSKDIEPEKKKPTPKPPRKIRKPRPKPKPKPKPGVGHCPCCFLCDCEQRTGRPCPLRRRCRCCYKGPGTPAPQAQAPAPDPMTPETKAQETKVPESNVPATTSPSGDLPTKE